MPVVEPLCPVLEEPLSDLLAFADSVLPLQEQRAVFRSCYEVRPPRNSMAVAQILRMHPRTVRYHRQRAEALVFEARQEQREGRIVARITIVQNGKVETKTDGTATKALRLHRRTPVAASTRGTLLA